MASLHEIVSAVLGHSARESGIIRYMEEKVNNLRVCQKQHNDGFTGDEEIRIFQDFAVGTVPKKIENDACI